MRSTSIVFLLIGVLIGATAIFALMSASKPGPTGARGERAQLYSCGMHPEVISSEPGNCPICGMKLTPIKSTSPQAGARPGGASKGERTILYWRAPMDPTEIYDHPGKSKMGMDLVPVYEGEEAAGAGSIAIEPSVQQNMNLRTAPVERRDISVVIRAFGTITYAQDRESSVNTKIGGWIEKLYVNTAGQAVKRGDPLLEIYSPELVSTQEEYLLALKNKKELAQSPYESIRQDADRTLAAARERLKYWDISDREIAEIERSGRTRRTVLLNSEIDGIVTHKAVVEGDKVGPGMDLLHIADLRRVWVEAAVYESEIPLLRLGQRAEIELDYRPEYRLEGKVDFIYPFLDSKSQANNVRLVFENPDLVLKPDMYATVRIFAPTIEHSLAVPAEAVLRSGTRDLVFVAQGEGTFEPREVKIGVESSDGFTQVVSGLLDGERVVVSGQFLLDSESRTREAIAKMRAASARKGMGSAMERDTSKAGEKAKEQKKQPHEARMEMPKAKSPEKAAKEAAPAGEAAPAKAAAPAKQAAPGQPAAPIKPAAPAKPPIDIDKLYACPMDFDFLTTDPNARCPECGMAVVPAKKLGDKIDLSKAVFYTCSMHPEFLTTDPNGRCPECGMKLEKAGKK
jgi:RND family efflux transporter MFP subunit